MEETLLKAAHLKSTKKRRLLLSLLKEESHPVTVETFYEKSRPILPMSLSTIYRGLNSLEEKGIVTKIIRQDGKAYYELKKQKHNHTLVCAVCHEKIAVHDCPLQELEETLAEKTGYQITGHHLEFTGICPKCANQTHETQKK